MISQGKRQWEGVLLLDKPGGMTSHDVVDAVRRKLGFRKVGHAGTLDPMATGLLIILVGKATKLSSALMSLDKVYTGTLRLGASTNTQDAQGEVVEEAEVPADLDLGKLQEAARFFLGDQYQTPPMFSAVKVKGVPLYKMARKGETVEREAKFIRVSRFEISRFESPDADFELHCSKGTYVRTLVHDLGEKMGCKAHMTALRRVSSDRFHLDMAVKLEDLQEMEPSAIDNILIPVADAVKMHQIRG